MPVLQWIDSDVVLIVVLALGGVLASIVGCMFKLHSQFGVVHACSSESVSSLASLIMDQQAVFETSNKYVPMGISHAKTPNAISVEYYNVTMTILSYLAFVISVALCSLIIVAWCTRTDNGIEQTLDIAKTLISSLKMLNRTLMSSLAATTSHAFQTNNILSITRKVVSTSKAGLLYINDRIRRIWNAITTQIFSLVEKFHKDTNQDVSSSADAEILLRRQLLHANEQLSQERDKLLCVICVDAPREVLLKPCKHFCLCSKCTNRLRECPICKQQIWKTEVIYNA